MVGVSMSTTADRGLCILMLSETVNSDDGCSVWRKFGTCRLNSFLRYPFHALYTC